MKKKAGFNISRGFIAGLNFVFALALLLSLVASRIPPTITTFFAVFGLLYPVLLLANIFFVLFWTFLKNKMLLVSLLIISAGYNNLSHNVRFTFRRETANQQDAVHLITYNVERFGLSVSEEKFKKTRNEVFLFLKGEDPGIVCLQEYHGKGKTLYEPLQEMKTGLGATSYYYESYFNPRYQQLTGLVIFSKYEAVNKGKLKFEGSRTFGIFTDLLIHNDTVRVFNIHLASIQLIPADIDFVVNPGQDKEEMGLHAMKIYTKLSEAFQLRELQMAFLKDEIKSSPYPVILAGDFNDTPSSFVYRSLTGQIEDCFAEDGRGFGRTYAGQLPLLRIDFIMKSPEFNTLDYRRYNIRLSDHYPVSALLSPLKPE
ncbi:MAG: endonuclease/exonuclease/phosphatase family protein [Bacteroidales bacterium]|nr:endonuclease/exonuclease/phosphatase family protein [Bacteroidales bacterium]